MKRTRPPKPRNDNPTPFTRAFNKGYDWLFKAPIYWANYWANQKRIEETLWQLTRQHLHDNPSLDLGSKGVREEVIREISENATREICKQFPRLELPRDKFTRQRLLSKIDGLVSKWLSIDRKPPEEPDPLDLPREMFPPDETTPGDYGIVDAFRDLSKILTRAEKEAVGRYAKGQPYDENAYQRARQKSKKI